jgi:hypothetical protein
MDAKGEVRASATITGAATSAGNTCRDHVPGWCFYDVSQRKRDGTTIAFIQTVDSKQSRQTSNHHMNTRGIPMRTIAAFFSIALLSLTGCAGSTTDAQEASTEDLGATPDVTDNDAVGTSSSALSVSVAKTEWVARLPCRDAACNLMSGANVALQNQYNRQFMVYQERDYGINLGWTATESRSMHFAVAGANGAPASNVVIKYGDRVAFQPKDHSFIQYGSRRWGINLVWAAAPAYEWVIEGGEVGKPVKLNQPFGLKNKRVDDFVVYCARPLAINLRWNGDCSSRQYTNPLPWP